MLPNTKLVPNDCERKEKRKTGKKNKGSKGRRLIGSGNPISTGATIFGRGP